MRALGAGVLCLAVLVAGCEPNEPVFKGTRMDGYFPFDGSERSWKMSNVDETVNYQLLGTLLTDAEFVEMIDDNVIYNVQWDRHCPAGAVDCVEAWEYTLKWAVDSVDGIMIYGYDSLDTGPVIWNPPIVMADSHMIVGESTQSTADGKEWTSTYAGVENCPIEYTDQWTECARMELSTASGDHWLEGVFHHVPSYNHVSMEFTNGIGRWSLIDVTYQP